MKTEFSNVKEAKKVIGVRLFKIAIEYAKYRDFFKKELRQSIKECKGRKQTINGSKSIESAVDAVNETIEMLKSIRKEKIRLKNSLVNQYPKLKNDIHLIFKSDIKSRLNNYKHKKLYDAIEPIKNLFKENYRYDNVSFNGVLTSDNDFVNDGGLLFRQSDYLDWDYYSKRCKYPKKIVDNIFIFSREYIKKVVDNGIAFLDDMLTIKAEEISREGNIVVYRAHWLRQSRGYNISIEEGYIAVDDEYNISYHGKKYKYAISGLKRKKTNMALNDIDLMSPFFKKFVKKFGDIKITKKHAKLAGACVSGTKNWCEAVGIDYDARESVTLDEVYKGYLEYPRYEVKSIVNKVIDKLNIDIYINKN